MMKFFLEIFVERRICNIKIMLMKKLKLEQNSKCDKTQKKLMLQNSKTKSETTF